MATNLPVRPSHIGIGLPGYALAPFMALLKAGCAVSSIAFHALETRAKFEMRGYPKNYVAIVSKPAQKLVS